MELEDERRIESGVSTLFDGDSKIGMVRLPRSDSWLPLLHTNLVFTLLEKLHDKNI